MCSAYLVTLGAMSPRISMPVCFQEKVSQQRNMSETCRACGKRQPLFCKGRHCCTQREMVTKVPNGLKYILSLLCYTSSSSSQLLVLLINSSSNFTSRFLAPEPQRQGLHRGDLDHSTSSPPQPHVSIQMFLISQISWPVTLPVLASPAPPKI